MALYKPGKGKRSPVEEALKDLDPATRELARSILKDLLEEDSTEIDREELLKRIEELKKKIQK